MAKKATKVIGLVLADHSGSMQSCRQTAQDAINGFFDERKKAATVPELWALVEFDTTFDDVFDFTQIADVPEYTLKPAGMTALMDAISHCVKKLEAQKAAKTAQKILVITTDGYENASKEHNKATIKKLLTEKQAEGWQVIYLAANQDAIVEGQSFGTNPNTSATMDMAFASAGTAGTSSMISRGVAGAGYSYSAAERSAAIGGTAAPQTQTWTPPNVSSGGWIPPLQTFKTDTDEDDEDEHYPSWL